MHYCYSIIVPALEPKIALNTNLFITLFDAILSRSLFFVRSPSFLLFSDKIPLKNQDGESGLTSSVTFKVSAHIIAMIDTGEADRIGKI